MTDIRVAIEQAQLAALRAKFVPHAVRSGRPLAAISGQAFSAEQWAQVVNWLQEIELDSNG